MALTAIAVFAAVVRAAFADRPPLAHTGGFGEPTCQQCHSDESLNELPGNLVLEGIPSTYAPGAEYTITVRLLRPDLARGGFQFAARIAEGSAAGRQAGSLSPVDARVNLADTVLAGFGAVQYARHTREPSASHDSVRWVLKWKAPARLAGAVVFHAVANAANDDDSPLGDYIYTTSGTTRPSPSAR